MTKLFSDGLFEEALLAPARSGADSLNIVSGYASAAMAMRHMDALRDSSLSPNVRLEVGMVPRDGISSVDHHGFKALVEATQGDFTCAYSLGPTWTHAKVYAWSRRGRPFVAFAGSANYTQTGFASGGSRLQNEVLVEVDAGSALDYVNGRGHSVDCGSDIPSSVSIFDVPNWRRGSSPGPVRNARTGDVIIDWSELRFH